MATQQWNAYRLMLATVMLITGSLNTLFGKWADRQTVVGTPGYPARPFNHPFFQACGMFVGEMLCGATFLILLLVRRFKGQSVSAAFGKMTDFKSVFIFMPPAMCDLTGTSLMFIGLNYTTAASYQMLRGAVIIFTALLSVAFLRRVISSQMWVGIFSVLVGLVIVGVSDIVFNPSGMSDINAVLTGDLLIIMAQVIASVQMVYEERFVTKLDVNPLLAVGLEGFFGFTVLSILTIPMYWIYVGPQFSQCPEYRLEDDLDAFAMMANSWQVTAAMIGMVLSIAFFNWAGISVTKELSATTRMVLDSCRTLVIWGATLALGWQAFEWLQIVGFVILTSGIFIYNGVLSFKLFRDLKNCIVKPREDTEGLVNEHDHEHDSHGDSSTA